MGYLLCLFLGSVQVQGALQDVVRMVPLRHLALNAAGLKTVTMQMVTTVARHLVSSTRMIQNVLLGVTSGPGILGVELNSTGSYRILYSYIYTRLLKLADTNVYFEISIQVKRK